MSFNESIGNAQRGGSDGLRKAAGEIGASLGDSSSDAYDKAEDLARSAQERTSDLTADAAELVSRNPLASIAIAAGLGYLLGCMSWGR
jgi:ElaB/YqjD/DUF883 family membrane-anchored ribosome-binding protein